MSRPRYRRQRIGEAPTGEVFLMVRGSKCDAESKDDGIHYMWKEGPIEVWIEPSFDTDRGKPDYRVSIWLFSGDKDRDEDAPVLQTWRPTAERCAAYATRKLTALVNALGYGRTD